MIGVLLAQFDSLGYSQVIGMCRPNEFNLVFLTHTHTTTTLTHTHTPHTPTPPHTHTHTKSVNMDPISIKKSLELGLVSQKCRTKCKISHFEGKELLKTGHNFRKFRRRNGQISRLLSEKNP